MRLAFVCLFPSLFSNLADNTSQFDRDHRHRVFGVLWDQVESLPVGKASTVAMLSFGITLLKKRRYNVQFMTSSDHITIGEHK